MLQTLLRINSAAILLLAVLKSSKEKLEKKELAVLDILRDCFLQRIASDHFFREWEFWQLIMFHCIFHNILYFAPSLNPASVYIACKFDGIWWLPHRLRLFPSPRVWFGWVHGFGTLDNQPFTYKGIVSAFNGRITSNKLWTIRRTGSTVEAGKKWGSLIAFTFSSHYNGTVDKQEGLKVPSLSPEKDII